MAFLVGTLAVLVYLSKEYLITIFTNQTKIQNIVLSVIWIVSFNTFPDGYKAMLRGVIRALELQKKCVYVNILGFGFVNISL